ncbi:hypothetical protein A2U01_0114123, partial [Trifolium medium]|nr:hypothetical protein [Trifolium medium]
MADLPPKAHKVWHLGIGSLPPGAVVGSKGWDVRPLRQGRPNTLRGLRW